jgi:hypothetical protein
MAWIGKKPNPKARWRHGFVLIPWSAPSQGGHAMADWEFTTTEFRDPEKVRQENVNRIEGAALARAVRAHLAAQGFECSDVIPEDYGWMFDATGPEGLYLCAVSLEPDEGEAMTGRVLTDKRRTVLDRLLGRNREMAGEAVPRAVEAFLRRHRDVRNLTDRSA